MFNLFIKEEVLNDYKNNFCEKAGINPSNIVTTFYSHFLREFSESHRVPVSDDTFKPVRFLVSIRTDYTNELIVPKNGKFYTDCSSSYPNEHPLDDMAILASKKLVEELFDCGEHITEIIPHTLPHVMGATLHEDIPYVYIHVVIDSKLKDNEHFKLKDCDYVPIHSIKPCDGLEKTLVSSLIIVKGGNENVHNDH